MRLIAAIIVNISQTQNKLLLWIKTKINKAKYMVVIGNLSLNQRPDERAAGTVTISGLTGKAFARFYSAIPSPESKRIYTSCLRHYMNFIKLESTDQLISKDIELLEQSLINYIDYQKEQGLSASVIRVRVAAIKLFYQMNKVELAWKIVSKTIGETKKLKDRPYTTDEIHRVLDNADIRGKVIVLLLTSTGMRIGAIPELKYGNLQKVDKYGIYQITVYEGSGSEYVTFCTPECARSIDDYLEYRKRYGENITIESPLIREQFDRKEAVRDFGKAGEARCIKVAGLEDNLRRLLIDAGLIDGANKYSERTVHYYRVRHPIKRAHGFRKFFDTECTKGGVHPLYIELLEGHNIALKGSYFRPTVQDLLEGNDRMLGYVSAIDRLTIYEEQRLKIKVRNLQEENSELQASNTRIKELEERQQQYERALQSFIDSGMVKPSYPAPLPSADS